MDLSKKALELLAALFHGKELNMPVVHAREVVEIQAWIVAQLQGETKG